MDNSTMAPDPYKRHKDHLKATLNQCGITPSHLETLVSDRTDWRSTCKSAVQEFESLHILELEAKRDLRKSFSARSVTGCAVVILDLLHVKSHASPVWAAGL